MKVIPFFIALALVGISLAAVSHAQPPSSQLQASDGAFWTLPIAECSGENHCEVRISPQGTIYNWDNINRILYVSRMNQDTYKSYDLTSHNDHIGFHVDFIPFDNEGYVVFFSSFGGLSNQVVRYDMNTGEMAEVKFPLNFSVVGCNRYTGVTQRQLRFILRLGMEGKFVACTTTDRSLGGPFDLIPYILDVNTLAIEQTLDVRTRFDQSYGPGWVIGGGLDNRLYIWGSYSGLTLPNLPTINEETQEIILVYDYLLDNWSYEIKLGEISNEIFADSPGPFFLNYLSTSEREIIQFNDEFQVIRRIEYDGVNVGSFVGVTLDGRLLTLSNSPAGLAVVNLSDYPLLVTPTPTPSN